MADDAKAKEEWAANLKTLTEIDTEDKELDDSAKGRTDVAVGSEEVPMPLFV